MYSPIDNRYKLVKIIDGHSVYKSQAARKIIRDLCDKSSIIYEENIEKDTGVCKFIDGISVCCRVILDKFVCEYENGDEVEIGNTCIGKLFPKGLEYGGFDILKMNDKSYLQCCLCLRERKSRRVVCEDCRERFSLNYKCGKVREVICEYDEILLKFVMIFNHFDSLTEWEKGFILNTCGWFDRLTEKQFRCVNNIHSKICLDLPRTNTSRF